jgi:cytochrome c oxidase assembly protein Cox11
MCVSGFLFIKMHINILVIVGIAGNAVVPLYKYMCIYLAIDGIHT